MSLPHAILGVLATGPRHGRAVARSLAHRLDGLRPVGAGQVYATLGRLTRRRLVTAAVDAIRDAHGVPLRTYALTPAGERALRRWLERAEVDPEVADGFVARLLVLHELGDAAGTARLVAARRARLVRLQAVAAARPLPAIGHDAAHDPPCGDERAATRDVAGLVREAALRLVATELAWLADVEARLLPARPPAARTCSSTDA
ncbi:PadR family transcriptional regulator [Candidatus Binatia bacterium]|nr:PadR family transcriptional regulator [Candidatus Binatia bacterium]